jgi:5'-nucleotidase
MGYDASIIGNHEFDFGPEVLAEFIGDAQTTNATTYLSSNLTFTAEPTLQAHVTAGRIAPPKLVSVPTAQGTKMIGIIGATTETLPSRAVRSRRATPIRAWPSTGSSPTTPTR